jgi:8-oxo-dGTP pyrophosphatase MutT (NUDIX family)
MEPGEDPADSLVREVLEETGHTIDDWSGPVWTRRHQFQFKGNSYDQREAFYLVRTRRFEPDHSGNPAEIEQEIFQEFRWWSLEEMRTSDEAFSPRDLARHLEDLIQLGCPAHPVDVGI